MLELNLYLTLKKHKNDIRKMLMNIGNNKPASRLGTRFGVDENISKQQDNQRS
jgi:hypothetical protein